VFRFASVPPVSVSAPASQRADAARNRQRIVAAARELFGAAGLDVSVRQIAGQAEVGLGTLYRHFPTREDLVDAVLEDAFDEYVAVAERALTNPDAWLGFTGFVEEVLELLFRNRALKEVIETRAHGRERANAMRARMRPLTTKLVKRAQKQGTLRADFAPQDLALIFWSCDRVTELAGSVAPNLWRRQLGFVLDGLRSQAAHPLPAPPLRESQVARVGIATENSR
jgi:AcrR family transcriptional regulator